MAPPLGHVIRHNGKDIRVFQRFEPEAAKSLFYERNGNQAIFEIAKSYSEVGNIDMLVQGTKIGQNEYELVCTIDVRRNGILYATSHIVNATNRAHAFLFGEPPLNAPMPPRPRPGMRRDEFIATRPNVGPSRTQATGNQNPPPPPPPQTPPPQTSNSYIGDAFRCLAGWIGFCIDYLVWLVCYPFRAMA